MSDAITYPQANHLVRMHARAVIAAALIESKVVDLSGTHLSDPVAAAQSPTVQKLKAAVDSVMTSVVAQ